MKIKKIHIYGFGQFENKVIDLHPSKTIDVFYGCNEAGKSTIMAFIHAIFFGFPARNQVDNSRYEPKSGAKYGGKVTIETKNNALLTIERVSGRATGELSIYDVQGNIYSEEELQALFKGLDRTLYQSIFSFGFKGLQAIEKITSEDLSHYLFSAGTTGGQALFELEKKVTKKIDELYKPSGRKPILNEKLTELEMLRGNLKKWEGKITVYNKCVEEQEHLKHDSHEIEEKITQQQLIINEYEKKLMLMPHIEEQRKWQLQLSGIPNHQPFPENGLERLEQLQHEIRPLKGQEQSLLKKLVDLEKEIENIQFRAEYINQEAHIRSLKEKQKVYEMQEIEKEKIRTSLNYEEIEIGTLIEKLGVAAHHEYSAIKGIDTSLVVREELKALVTKYERLEDQQAFLDEQFNKAKRDLEVTETNYQKLKQAKQKNNPTPIMLVLSIVVIAAGIVLWMMSDSVYPLIISVILLYGIVLNKFTAKSGSGQQLEKEHVILKQKERLFEDILKQYESWEQEFRKVNQDLTAFCKQQKLPQGLSVALLMNAFEWIEELKKRIRHKNQYVSELSRIEGALSTFQEAVEEMIEFFNLPFEPSLLALNQMIAIIEAEKEKKNRVQQLKEKEQELSDEKATVEQQLRFLESEVVQLISSAEVEDEGTFRQKGMAYEEYKSVNSKLQSVESYLHSVLKAGEEHFPAEIIEENIPYQLMIEKINEELLHDREQLKQMQVRMADVTVEIKNLEEGTTYSDLVHRYEVVKAEFQEAARRWAVYKVAKDLIERTKGFYREVRLPKVVETAQNYFSFLTFEKYPLIFAPTEETGFMVERDDGFRFAPNELSQATTEQLYLSLRLALANNFHSLTPLPILIDDSFVNFDMERTKRALQLIQNISNEHQILFFTCHKHIQEFFAEDEVINL